MKLFRGTLLILAFICFVLAVYLDGWRSLPPGTASAARPNYLSIGLALWVLSEIVT